jgi:hypothetical protein
MLDMSGARMRVALAAVAIAIAASAGGEASAEPDAQRGDMIGGQCSYV